MPFALWMFQCSATCPWFVNRSLLRHPNISEPLHSWLVCIWDVAQMADTTHNTEQRKQGRATHTCTHTHRRGGPLKTLEMNKNKFWSHHHSSSLRSWCAEQGGGEICFRQSEAMKRTNREPATAAVSLTWSRESTPGWIIRKNRKLQLAVESWQTFTFALWGTKGLNLKSTECVRHTTAAFGQALLNMKHIIV